MAYFDDKEIKSTKKFFDGTEINLNWKKEPIGYVKVGRFGPSGNIGFVPEGKRFLIKEVWQSEGWAYYACPETKEWYERYTA